MVATGLTNADYQDTGLTSNTVYGYRYLANDGADSGDSPTVYVTTLSADSAMVQFPDATWEKIIGPLAESAQIPFVYYTNTMTAQAQEMGAKFPVVAPSTIKGTGAINNGSNILTGTNTHFLEEVAANNPACLDAIAIGGTNAGAIASVDSNTQITLVTNWAGGNVSGQSLSTNVSGLCGFSDPINDYITANQLGYYDSPSAMWKVYFMTGDPQYMRRAIQFNEGVFAGYMWLGRNRAWNGFSTTPNTDNMPAPRNFQFTGYVLLGLAGHVGVWDLLDDYLTARYATWISNYRGGDSNFMFIREKGYMILFTTQFVVAAPDSFPRSNGTVTSLNGGTTVDGDLTDGRKDFWRDQLDIDVPGFILTDQTAAGEWYEFNAGSDHAMNDMPYPPGVEQPWITGLVVDALGTCWRNTALSSTARDTARKMVLRAAAFMATRGYNTNVEADETGIRYRTAWYFLGGGNRLNPFAFEHGSDAVILNNTPDNNMVAQYRQALPFYMSPLGFAYEMSGQAVYKTFGDEMANAAFAAIGEDTGGTGDGKKSLCDADNNYKDYGQCYRTSPNYFGQRLLTPSSLGTPPDVTMPGNQTLTGGVNQSSLTASVACTNTPCNYKWYLVEYPLMSGREAIWPVFSADTSLSTTISGLEAGVYKIGFYALDNLGMMDYGTVNVTVGDGVFPPVVHIHKSGGFATCTATSSATAIHVRAYSAAGRSLTHSFSAFGPKDASAPTITPSGTTGNFITVDLTNLAAGPSWYVLKDVVTDSAGTTRTAYFHITRAASSCSSTFAQPSGAHNTVPTVVAHPNHILPPGSTSTDLYVNPIDPEGWTTFTSTATGYTTGYNGTVLVTALSHSWSQTAGPVSATITNGSTLRPKVSGMTTAGTYTFRYTGTDQQSDSITANINVTVQSGASVTTCKWHTSPPCNQ